MKSSTYRLTAAMLTVIMIFVSLLPSAVIAKENADEFRVIVSVEGATLGQGLYVEPKSYTLDQINELVSSEGYGPYERSDLTAAMATLAMLIDHNIEYGITGSWDSDVYIAELYGLDTRELSIPSVITENAGGYPSNEDNDGNDDDWLGQFDYSSMAGWMITVNDLMIPVGSSQFGLEDFAGYDGYRNYGDTYVIRWQFTLYGYGADLGHSTGWGLDAFYDRANKDLLYAAYADSSNEAAKAAALPVMENLTAAQTEVDAALEALIAVENEESNGRDIKPVLNATMAALASSIPEPQFGTTGGEWTVLALARGGYYAADSEYFTAYYDRIVSKAAELSASVNQGGALHSGKYTENSRLIMALSSIGRDSTKVGDVDIVAPLNDFDKTVRQGINGPIFALIALDTNNYQTEDATIRRQYVDKILSLELDGGGWALSGSSADPDITAMALQALVNYRDRSAVADAAARGFEKLSAIQKDNGGYASWGSVNSESIAQVIVACTAWGINPDTDPRFIKNGNSALSALLGFYVENEAKFRHTTDGASNAMATDQACYALVAYDRFVSQRNPLYDMTDAFPSSDEPAEIAAALTLPEKIENTVGTSFNATISLNTWDSEAGYKLMDCIVSIPNGIDVTSVIADSRLDGGELCCYFEESTGKLRIVYFDATNGNDISVSGNDFPAAVLTVGLKIKEAFDLSIINEITVSVSGMSLKKNSQSDDPDSMTIVNIQNAGDTAMLVKGVSFTAMTLYNGDGVDLISEDQVAVAVAVTGVEERAKILWNDGKQNIELLYNDAVSAKTGVPTYLCITSPKLLSRFASAENYTVEEDTANTLTFGDINGDGVINAQDALSEVNAWLRKSDAPDEKEILAMNVNADARINTFDALGIVEYFVNGKEFSVIGKAATIKDSIEA